MSSPIRIIRAGLGDIDLVAPLFDSYRQFYQQPPDPAAAREYVGQRVSRDESVVFLALTGFGPRAVGVGFTQLYPSFSSVGMRKIWILNDLFVHPDHRRGGVARLLIEKAESFARDDGAVRIKLQTEHTNTSARTLYEKLGWEFEDKYVQYKKKL